MALGNDKLLAEIGAAGGKLEDHAETLRREGETVMYVVVDGRAVGLIGVADPIKESTPEAIRLLREDGIRIVMLTGDNRTTAAAVGRKLGLDEVIAEVLPDQKRNVVKRLRDEGRVLRILVRTWAQSPARVRTDVSSLFPSYS